MSLFTLFKSLKLVFKRKKGRSTEAKSLTECNDLLGNFITEKEVRCYKYSNFKAMMKEDHFICAKFEEEFFFLKLLNNDSETISRVIHELELFHNISHRNILKFCGVSRIEGIEGRIINTNKHHILVLEYADSGSLSTYLDKNFDELNWNDKINLAFQLASARASRILVHQKSIKLTVFGSFKELQESSSDTILIFSFMPYMDPESFNTQNLNFQLDKTSNVYSIGILLWQIS
ncbi:hypothetical protein RhiirC2_850515, partial [Rhizophagus irregularis]